MCMPIVVHMPLSETEDAPQEVVKEKPPYLTVKVNRALAEKIKEIIKLHPDLGYTNLSSLVNDAVRRRTEELEAFC